MTTIHDKSLVAEFYTTGVGAATIGNALGVSRQRVLQIINELGLPTRKSGERMHGKLKVLEERLHQAYRRNLRGIIPAKMRQAYTTQKNNARHRGIDWEFDLISWWRMWEPHWKERGRSGLVMGRNGDIGPYSPTNVRIITAQENTQEWRYRW